MELRLNAVAFHAELDRARSNLGRTGKSSETLAGQMREGTVAIRAMGGEVLSKFNPALGGAVSAFSAVTREAKTLPIALGLTTLAVGAASIGLSIYIEKLDEAQKFTAKLGFAQKSADLGAIRGLLSDNAQAMELFRIRAEQASKALQGQQVFRDLAQGKVGGLQDFGKGALANIQNALTGAIAAAQNFFAPKGLEQLKKESAEAGEALKHILPSETVRITAEWRAALDRVNLSLAQIQAESAATQNDLDGFTQAMRVQQEAAGSLALKLEEARRARGEFELAQIRARTELAPGALDIELANKRREIETDIVKIRGDALTAELQGQEKLRVGRLAIIERRQAAFPPEPGIEEAGLHEALGAGIPLGTTFPEVLARGREAARGFDDAIAAIIKTGQLLGPTMDAAAEELSAVEAELRRLAATDLPATDSALQALASRFQTLQVRQTMQELSRETKIAEAQARLLGGAFDETPRKIELIQAAMVSLLREGIDPTDARLQRLKADFDRLRDIEGVKDAFRGTFQDITSSLINTIRTAQNAGDAMLKIVDNAVTGFANRMLNVALRPLEEELARLAGRLGGFIFGAPSGTPTAGTDVALAKGGVIGGDFLPFRAFATGGVARRPTLGLIAEHPGMQEAVIPLQGGAIPVAFQGGGDAPRGAVPSVIVQVINQVPGAESTTQESTGPNGERLIQILVAKAFRDQLHRGAFDRDLGLGFGMSRRPVGR